jgi:hypothetical protein
MTGIQVIYILVYWNPPENGTKPTNFFCHPNNSKWCQQLKATILGKLP